MSWFIDSKKGRLRKRRAFAPQKVCERSSRLLTGAEENSGGIMTSLIRVESSSSSDRLRQPDNLPVRLGPRPNTFGRLTALRPYLAAGLPLSCAIGVLKDPELLINCNSLKLLNIIGHCLSIKTLFAAIFQAFSKLEVDERTSIQGGEEIDKEYPAGCYECPNKTGEWQ